MLTPKGGSSDRMLEPLSGMSESGGHLEFGQDRKATASAEGRGTTGDVPLLRWPDKPICLPKCGYGTAWQTVHSEGRRMMTAVSSATTTTDLYPTRSGETTEVLPRTGPIVFGSADDGPLAATELKHFEDTGYLTIDQLISPEELTLFTDELHRLSQDPEVKADEATVVEAKSDEVRSIFDIHRTNAIFKKIANDPR